MAGGLGEEYAKRSSIPQGDPMSMAVVALLMRAWIMEMRHCAVQPRLLADDIQTYSTGGRRLENFRYAYDRTHLHLQQMGANVAPNKCNTFSSEASARKWLKEHRWRRVGKKISVINDCRDLGAHFNATGGKKVGATVTQRMWKTARPTDRLAKIRAPYSKKVEIIRNKKLPMGLYGCKVAPVNENALRAMRASIASCLTFTTVRRSADLTFAIGSRTET